MTFEPHFNGADYIPPIDFARLTRQHERILQVMIDQEWHTLAAVETITGDPQPSISAQFRHLRKKRFGGYIIDKRMRDDGVWEYRLAGVRADADDWGHRETRPHLKLVDANAPQLKRVKAAMIQGQWRTLGALSEITGDPPASVSARLRDLRKLGYDVQRRRSGLRGRGLYEYRLLAPVQAELF